MEQYKIDYEKAKEDCKNSSENIIKEKGGECERIKQKILSTDADTKNKQKQSRTGETVTNNEAKSQTEHRRHHTVINPLPPELFDPLAALILERLRVSYFEDFKKSFRYLLYLKVKILEKREVQEKDFATLRVLGRGGFGMVSACKKKDTGRLYALKLMNKQRVKTNRISF